MDLFNRGCQKQAILGSDFCCWRQNDAATRSQQLVTSASTEREAGDVYPQKGRTEATPARSVGCDIEHQGCAHSAAMGVDINRWAVLGNLPSTWADSVGKWQGSVCLKALCQLAPKWQNKKGRQGQEAASPARRRWKMSSGFLSPQQGPFLLHTNRERKMRKNWRVSWSGDAVQEKTALAGVRNEWS